MRDIRTLAILLAALLAAPARAGGLASYLAHAELAPLAQPRVVLPFVFGARAGEAGTLDVPLDADEARAFIENPDQRYLLRLRTRHASDRLEVRQRSVIYMNIDDSGPHYPIPATERRGLWQAARARLRGVFEVGGLPAPPLRLTRTQLVAAVRRSEAGRDPHWIALARQCKSPEDGNCYTVVDNEYEVTVRRQGRVLARGVLRLRQPTGC
jgi:hypothetical protein